MSRMLTLVPASARPADPAGDARASDGGFPSLRFADDTDAADHHRAAAEQCLAAGRFRGARRHLIAALRRAPGHARCRYLLGQAFGDDPHGCDRRAARHYRKAATLNASEPIYRAALGRALVRIDDVRSGVNVLRRAAEAAPADANVLTIVAEGLREAGESELAFQLLSKARFLAPADRAVRQLWQRARFDVAAEGQRTQRGEPAAELSGQQAGFVPFLRLVGGNGPARTRHDLPQQPAAHVGRLLRPFRG